MNNFDEAARLLAQPLGDLLLALPEQTKEEITELRVRRGRPLVVMLGSRTCFLTDGGKLINHCSARALSVTDAAFDALFAAVCAYSVHTHMGTLVEGFVTAPNGNRVGIAATAVEKDGTVTAIRDVQSLNIRIAREERGCARGVLNTLFVGRLPSIIVAAPPGGGKTTVLRDLARALSGGFGGRYRKVSIVDERGEFGGFSPGVNTDVLTGFGKKKGIEIAVRTLSPELIVCDEIADDAEVDAIKAGFSSGVAFAVSVHIRDAEDLVHKSIIKKLYLTGEFDYVVLLEEYADTFSVVDLRGGGDEDPWTVDDRAFLRGDRYFTGS